MVWFWWFGKEAEENQYVMLGVEIPMNGGKLKKLKENPLILLGVEISIIVS